MAKYNILRFVVVEKGPNTKPLALCRARHRVRLPKGSLGETKVRGVMSFIGKRRTCHNCCQLRTRHFVFRMSRGRFFVFTQVRGAIPFAPPLRKSPRARPPFHVSLPAHSLGRLACARLCMILYYAEQYI